MILKDTRVKGITHLISKKRSKDTIIININKNNDNIMRRIDTTVVIRTITVISKIINNLENITTITVTMEITKIN